MKRLILKHLKLSRAIQSVFQITLIWHAHCAQPFLHHYKMRATIIYKLMKIEVDLWPAAKSKSNQWLKWKITSNGIAIRISSSKHIKFHTKFMKIHENRIHFCFSNRCDICNTSFQCRRVLTRHNFNHHKSYKFICKVCGKNLRRKCYLDRHMKKHDGTRERNFICKTCNKG